VTAILKSIVTIAGCREGEARAATPRLLARLRSDAAVACASAEWEAARSCLVVTVESSVAGPAGDADEADNFHRVWRAAVGCLGGAEAFRFDLDGSIELSRP
jgi:hypothetical protein